MRYIEFELGGQNFRARLLEDKAPKTCEALWNALPFGGRAVHAMLSGNMFRMYDAAPIEVDAVENGVAYQHPGLIVYYPPLKEIAICYDDARFRGAAHAVNVTPLAEVEGDIGLLAKTASALQFEGAKPIEFRRSEAGAASATTTTPKGAQLEVRLGDAVVTATLLEEQAPRTCEGLRKLLPLEGFATNTKWSGDMLHFWVGERAKRGTIGLEVDPVENPTRFHWPGYLYYYVEWQGIRIPYSDNAQMMGAFATSIMTAFARFNGDWSAFRDTASQLFLTGAVPMSMRVKD